MMKEKMDNGVLNAHNESLKLELVSAAAQYILDKYTNAPDNYINALTFGWEMGKLFSFNIKVAENEVSSGREFCITFHGCATAIIISSD